MRNALRKQEIVQLGGKIENVDQDFPAGERVEVVISPAPVPSLRSAWQTISESPGQRLFKNAKEVDDYLAEERASWEL